MPRANTRLLQISRPNQMMCQPNKNKPRIETPQRCLRVTIKITVSAVLTAIDVDTKYFSNVNCRRRGHVCGTRYIGGDKQRDSAKEALFFYGSAAREVLLEVTRVLHLLACLYPRG